MVASWKQQNPHNRTQMDNQLQDPGVKIALTQTTRTKDCSNFTNNTQSYLIIP